MSEILLILVFALLVYGGRLPEVARSLGRAIATVKQNLMATQSAITNTVEQATDAGDADDRPRSVRRIAAAELAKEDVSGASGSSDAPVAPAGESAAPAASPVVATEPTPSGEAAGGRSPADAATRPPGPPSAG